MFLLVSSCSNLWPEKCGCKWVPVQVKLLMVVLLASHLMHTTTGWLHLLLMIQKYIKCHPVISKGVVYWVALRGLWNSIGFQVKFNKLHPNEHTQRIFWYFVRRFRAESSKIGHFQSSESIFEAKYQLNLPENSFLSEYQIRRTTFVNNIFNFNHSSKSLFSKNVPNFWRLCLKLSYNISKNSLSVLIGR